MSKKRNKEELPWVDIQLSAQEIAILNDESGDLSKLYIALSQRRDFSTGIVGIRTRLSCQAIKEVMSLAPRSGRPQKTISTRHVQRWMDQLKNCGLIIEKGRYIFELPKSPKYDSESGRCHQIWNSSVTRGVTKQECDKSTINIDYLADEEDKVSPEVSPEVSPDLGTPPKISEDLPNKHIMLLGVEQISDFSNLLNEYGFRPEQILHIKTMAMIKGWMAEGISIAEAKEGIEATNAAKGIPGHPTYYLRAVLGVKKAKLEADKEISDERLREARRPGRKSERDLDAEASRKWDDYLNSGD